MKNFFFIVSVLLLSPRLHNVQGGGIGKISVSEGHAQKLQGKSSDAAPRFKDGVTNVAAAVRKKAHSSSAGMNRKLVIRKTLASITLTTSCKKLEGDTIISKEASENDDFRLKTWAVSQEVLDMAEVDYSPAKKRSPIHN